MALEAASMGLWCWDALSGRSVWDLPTCHVFGCDPSGAPANYDEYIALIYPEDRSAVQNVIADAMHSGRVYYDVEHRFVRPDGAMRWILGKSAIIRSTDGTVLRIIGGIVDITERVQSAKTEAENSARLIQLQQMEMVGRLAGGLAHDFNNLLTVINGSSDLLLKQLGATDPLRDAIETISKAGASAAELTRQLLAYGRKQLLRPQVIDLNQTITSLRPMLQLVAGEDVQLRLRLEAGVASVRVDPVQFEQVVINLVLNARDALPRGGELLIESACVDLDELSRSHSDQPVGRYVMLAVSDSGLGMDEETRKRVFEPFFTTKEIGEGSGLGLSSVHGIVTQSGGSITVHSEPGHGTKFEIYLPRITQEGAPEVTFQELAHAQEGKGTILVVEDRADVRDHVASALTAYGYRVVKAGSAAEALSAWEREHDRIDVVLTDVLMPAISGPELAARLRTRRPGIKVVYMSGYAANKIEDPGFLNAQTDFIQKPFTPRQLLVVVSRVLGQQSS
jgi:signal transduction histidine kinase